MDDYNQNYLKTRRLGLNSIQSVELLEVNKILSFIENISKKELKRFIYELIDLASNIRIGYCGFILTDYKEVICFYFLHPQFRGNGYAIEALKKLIEFIFSFLDLSQIITYIPSQNESAWKVAERSGMMYIGDMHHHDYSYKIMKFKIIKSDYEKQTFY